MQRVSFCDGWEFARNGGLFEPVVVPHDAMLANRRDADAPAGSASGYYHGARYCYRKRFELTREQAQRALLLEFEGVYRDAALTVNGTPVSAPPYGFIPFFADVSGLVHAGSNEIEVRASNAAQPDCRWYSGAGLHRPVWLWEGGAAHIAPEGVRITTVSCDPATVRVDVTVEDGRDDGRAKGASDARTGFAGDLSVLATLRDPKGAGAFIVKGETTWYNPSVKSYVRLFSGCFYPQTAAGLPPSGEFYIPNDYVFNGDFFYFTVSADSAGLLCALARKSAKCVFSATFGKS